LIGIEAVNCLQQAEARHLEQIVERLVRVAVAQREVAGEGQESLRELLPCGEVAVAVVADQELVLELPCGRALATLGLRDTGQPRRCEGDCTHHEPPSVSYLT
jgi:hypothetical protein